MTTIDRVLLAQQLEVEQRRFVETHPLLLSRHG